MSTAEVLKHLKHLNNAERLTVIEAATQLIREELSPEASKSREAQDQRLRQAALAIKDFYEPGGELTEWTNLDAEEILDEPGPG